MESTRSDDQAARDLGWSERQIEELREEEAEAQAEAASVASASEEFDSESVTPLEAEDMANQRADEEYDSQPENN